ncbi:MAG: hypothetical protein PQJ46_07105 [Spirochaetales bacterium]|nr:hypothetical protein [Spirochaetales bacterium]
MFKRFIIAAAVLAAASILMLTFTENANDFSSSKQNIEQANIQKQ